MSALESTCLLRRSKSGEAARQIEEYWDDLLAFIDEKHVIPVVGPELLEVQEGGKRIGLYDAVARRLLHRFGLSAATPAGAPDDPATVTLRRHYELNDAVCAPARRGRRVQDRALTHRPACPCPTCDR